MNVGTLTAYFELDAKNFYSTMGKVESTMTSSSRQIDKSMSNMNGTINKSVNSFDKLKVSAASASIKLAAVGAAAVIAYKGLIGVAKAIGEIESMSRALEFATGSAKAAATEMAFLTANSSRLGVSLRESIKGFSSMAAAARGSSIEMEDLRQIYLSITEAGTVLGLSSNRMKMALIAVQQMMSKGKISAEELNQQLAEHIPGAAQIMSRALGVTTQQLLEMAKKGELLSEKVLPAFAAQLRQEVAPSVEAAGKGINAQLARLENSWFQLQKAIMGSPLIPFLRASIDGITASVKGLTSAFGALAEFFKPGKIDPTGLSAVYKQVDKEYAKQLEMLEKQNTKRIEAAEKITAETFALKDLTEAQKDNNATLSSTVTTMGSFSAQLDKIEIPNITEKMQLSKSITELQTFYQIGVTALEGFNFALTEFVKTGKIDFKEFTRSLIADMTSIVIKMLVVLPLIEALKASMGSLAFGGGGSGNSGFNSNVSSSGGASKWGNKLASAASSSGAPSSSQSMSPASSTNINLSINALDSRSLVDLMSSNPQAVTAPLVEALNMGDRGVIQSIKGAL